MQRIAHVTLILQDVPGIANKLEAQAEICSEAKIPIDFYWLAGTEGPNPNSFDSLKIQRLNYSSPFRLRYKQAKILSELQVDYDKIILRYPLWIQYYFYLLRIKKYYSRAPYYGIRRTFRTKKLETFYRKIFCYNVVAIFWSLYGSFKGDRKYHSQKRLGEQKSIFIPNSIKVGSEPLQNLSNKGLRMIFVASRFDAWHGLDLILEVLSRSDLDFQLDIVGKCLSGEEKKFEQDKRFNFLGSMDVQVLRASYKNYSLAVGSLAMIRNGMKEASTLKVREYLAHGLPVILSYNEVAFPENFPYICNMNGFELGKFIAFKEKLHGVSKEQVRTTAKPYIDGEVINKQLYDFCIGI